MLNTDMRVLPKFSKGASGWQATAYTMKHEEHLGYFPSAAEAVYAYDIYKTEHDVRSYEMSKPKRARGYNFPSALIKKLAARDMPWKQICRVKWQEDGIWATSLFGIPSTSGPFNHIFELDELIAPLAAHFERFLWRDVNYIRYKRLRGRPKKASAHWEILEPEIPVIQNTHVAMVIFNKIAHDVGFFPTMYEARAAAKQAAKEFQCPQL